MLSERNLQTRRGSHDIHQHNTSALKNNNISPEKQIYSRALILLHGSMHHSIFYSLINERISVANKIHTIYVTVFFSENTLHLFITGTFISIMHDGGDYVFQMTVSVQEIRT